MPTSGLVKKFLLFLTFLALLFAGIAQAQAQVTLTTISPNSGQAGITNIVLFGSGFPGGTISPANVSVGLTPTGGGSPLAITPASVITVGGTIRRVIFQLSNTVTVPTQYQVSLSDPTDGFSSLNSLTFTQNPLPSLGPLSPSFATQGASLNVAITGLFTNFVQGATIANFGAGISVNSFTVTNATTATANITLGALAATGPRTITVATGIQQESATFTVNQAQVSVPNVVGQTQAAASSAITGAGLVVGTVTQQFSSTVPSGSVISQNPAGGTLANPGSAVDLVVSKGPAPVSVPNVVGQTQVAASSAITGAGLVVGTVTQQFSSTVPSGSVISQNPIGGTLVAPGSAVDLVVSKGPAPVSVPNVVGQTQAAATSAITGAGLVVGTVTQQPSGTVPAGSVISQNPIGGTLVAPGSAVDLVISSGPAQVAVPNVVGQTQAAATSAITGAGLVVGTVTQQSSNTVPAGSVISQNPVGGTLVNAGSAVDLVISSGPAQVAVPNVVGQTQAAATSAITGAGLVVGTVTQQSSNTVPAGSVISQNPVGGTLVNLGSAVDLVISSGPAQSTVPNVVGETQTQATTDITNAGLVVGTVTQQSSNTVPAGSVISQNPTGGTVVSPGSAVDLVVSTGVQATSSVSGKITLLSGGGLQGATVSLGAGLTATTAADGSYTISNVSNGSYTLTPTFTVPAGDSVVFYPATQSLTVSSNLTDQNFTAQLGYTVSGTLSYTGRQRKTSVAYLRLQPSGCSACATQGTSLVFVAKGSTGSNLAFSIHGVPRGTYNLQAFFDLSGYGAPNLADPATSSSIPVTVAASNVTGVSVPLTDPATAGDVSQAPVMTISKIDTGVMIYYQPITVGGVEQALGYNLNWSTLSPADCNAASPTKGGGLNLSKGDPLFEDSGRMVILDGKNQGNPFFATVSGQNKGNGSIYFFCMAGINGSGTVGPFTTQQVTLAAPPATSGPGTSTVTVNVTVPDSTPINFNPVSINGPLYMGCYDAASHSFYALSDESPTDPLPGTQAYAVHSVPNGTQCSIFGVVDQDSDGLVNPTNPWAGAPFSLQGDIFNLGRTTALVSIAGDTTQDADLTPYTENSSASLTTQHIAPWVDASSNPQPESFGVNFDVRSLVELPVGVQLASGPNLNSPMDFARCATCNRQGEFNMTLSTSSVAPQAGDSYPLSITDESTGVIDTPTLTVSGVLSAFTTSLNASGGITPTFTWGYPANPTDYSYQFTLTDSNGNVIWQIPAATGTGFSSTVVTTGITWPNDPTGATNPPATNLVSGQKYIWTLTTFDSNGNAAQQKQVYQP